MYVFILAHLFIFGLCWVFAAASGLSLVEVNRAAV